MQNSIEEMEKNVRLKRMEAALEEFKLNKMKLQQKMDTMDIEIQNQQKAIEELRNR